MLESIEPVALARNLSIYAVGVLLAIVGALGMAAAVDLDPLIATPSLFVGLAIVIAVHEFLGGPF